MRYNELERLLRKKGCYYTGTTCNGHPLWHSPITGRDFLMGHHRGEEVATGTLYKIIKTAGLK